MHRALKDLRGYKPLPRGEMNVNYQGLDADFFKGKQFFGLEFESYRKIARLLAK